MAKLISNTLALPELTWDGNFNRSAHHKAFQRLMEDSNAIDPNLPLVNIEGAVLQFQVADGYASYVVIEDRGGDDFTVQHIGYLDGYEVHPALIRGLLRSDVLAQIREWHRIARFDVGER